MFSTVESFTQSVKQANNVISLSPIPYLMLVFFPFISTILKSFRFSYKLSGFDLCTVLPMENYRKSRKYCGSNNSSYVFIYLFIY